VSVSIQSSFPQTDVLAVFYDMGETAYMKLAIDQLKIRGISTTLLALGTAAVRAVEAGYDPKRIVFLKDIEGVKTEVSAQGWPRHAVLPKQEVQLIAKEIARLKPRCILSSPHATVPRQLSRRIFKECGLPGGRLFCCWDTPHTIPANHPDGGMEQFLRADRGYHFLVPSQPIADSIKTTKATAVGHSPIEEFAREIDAAGQNRSAILKRLKLPEKPRITYIGGYDEGYDDSFRLFLKGVTWMRENGEPDLQVIVQIHPKFASNPLEDIREYQLACEQKVPNINICVKEPKTPGIGRATTPEAVAIASLVLSTFSTVIPQAIAAGIPGHFVNVNPKKLDGNTMMEAGVCKNLQTGEEMMHALRSPIKQGEDFFTISGIPKNAAKVAADVIEQSLT